MHSFCPSLSFPLISSKMKGPERGFDLLRSQIFLEAESKDAIHAFMQEMVTEIRVSCMHIAIKTKRRSRECPYSHGTHTLMEK